MKRSALVGILVFCLTSFFLTAQTILPQACGPRLNPITNLAVCVDGTMQQNGVSVDFERVNDDSLWQAFYLFDDGYFSGSQDPSHNFRSPGPHDVICYSADDYDPTIPDFLTTIPVHSNGGGVHTNLPNLHSRNRGNNSSSSNGTKSIINLGSSWIMAADRSLIYIIPFTHSGTYPYVAESGTVSLQLDPRINFKNFINPANTNPNTSSWFEKQDPPQNGNNTVTWDFKDLLPGETRIFYLEVDVPTSAFDTISHRPNNTITSTATVTFTDIFPGTFSIPLDLPIREPRDPNYIKVNYESIRAHHTDNQELIYDVGFSNNGDWFVEDIYVDVTIDDYWNYDVNSVQLLHHNTVVQNVGIQQIADNVFRFSFDDINLPGANQQMCHNIFPTAPTPPCNVQYLPNESKGEFSFRICANDNLEPTMLTASADITFVGVSTITANPAAYTMVNPGTPAVPRCGYGNNDDEDVDGLAASNTDGADAVPSKNTNSESKNHVFPNPFNNSFVIPYEVNDQTQSVVNIQLFSATGQRIGTINLGSHSPGKYTYEYNASALSAGVYFLQTQNGSQVSTQRIVKAQ